MEYISSSIRTVIARVITDKPVRKTPYQVKGVFMRQYPDLEIVPMMDGTYRDRFLYPRVQIKILNEQVYMIGIHEGVDPIVELADRLDILDFGNITFQVFDTDVNIKDDQFRAVDRLVRYRLLTPWVALNQTTGSRYRFLNNMERIFSIVNKSGKIAGSFANTPQRAKRLKDLGINYLTCETDGTLLRSAFAELKNQIMN